MTCSCLSYRGRCAPVTAIAVHNTQGKGKKKGEEVKEQIFGYIALYMWSTSHLHGGTVYTVFQLAIGGTRKDCTPCRYLSSTSLVLTWAKVHLPPTNTQATNGTGIVLFSSWRSFKLGPSGSALNTKPPSFHFRCHLRLDFCLLFYSLSCRRVARYLAASYLTLPTAEKAICWARSVTLYCPRRLLVEERGPETDQ